MIFIQSLLQKLTSVKFQLTQGHICQSIPEALVLKLLLTLFLIQDGGFQ